MEKAERSDPGAVEGDSGGDTGMLWKSLNVNRVIKHAYKYGKV